ncbi:MAG: Na+/H+ antiporter NhaA [Acidobacteriota bacterium]
MKKTAEHVQEFFQSEKAGGIVLIGCTLASLILANSGIGSLYREFWHGKIAGMSLEHWINDGLMAVFFFFVGLELKREIVAGELSDLKKASLAVVAALGGMIVPAFVYSLFNFGTDTQSGAGIPMATDIVFAIGILSLLGSRMPSSLTVLLTALAVIDDLGAIVVIAVFYSSGLSWIYLGAALVVFTALLVIGRFRGTSPVPHVIGGLLLWYCMLNSGIHATIAGVLLALAVPFGDGSAQSLSHRFEHWLDRPVSFLILPVFALANTAIALSADIGSSLLSASSLGIITGLWAGKPVGIVLFAFLGVKLGISRLPHPLTFLHIGGMGFLGGIGFTMSMFITLLAFAGPGLIAESKIAILVSSLLAGVTGYAWLRLLSSSRASHAED